MDLYPFKKSKCKNGQVNVPEKRHDIKKGNCVPKIVHGEKGSEELYVDARYHKKIPNIWVI